MNSSIHKQNMQKAVTGPRKVDNLSACASQKHISLSAWKGKEKGGAQKITPTDYSVKTTCLKNNLQEKQTNKAPVLHKKG